MTIMTTHPLHFKSGPAALETYINVYEKEERHGNDDDPDAANHHHSTPVTLIIITTHPQHRQQS